MRRYVLSEAADTDISHILRESVRNWGWIRAERYILELHAAFENLAMFPGIGTDAADLRDGYLRFPHGSHTVFYQSINGGILIVRLLHQKQLPENYL